MQKLHTNKFENLAKVNNFQGKLNLIKLTQKATENHNEKITTIEI